MLKHCARAGAASFTSSRLHPMGLFLNPPGAVDWQTGRRALDIYKCAQHVDRVVHQRAAQRRESRRCLCVSVEGSIQRNANSYRPFTAGLYLGRHVNGDIYRVATGGSIATHIANGAKGLLYLRLQPVSMAA